MPAKATSPSHESRESLLLRQSGKSAQSGLQLLVGFVSWPSTYDSWQPMLGVLQTAKTRLRYLDVEASRHPRPERVSGRGGLDVFGHHDRQFAGRCEPCAAFDYHALIPEFAETLDRFRLEPTLDDPTILQSDSEPLCAGRQPGTALIARQDGGPESPARSRAAGRSAGPARCRSGCRHRRLPCRLRTAQRACRA